MSIELASIFTRFGVTFRSTHPISSEQQRVFNAVLSCRTPALGMLRHR